MIAAISAYARLSSREAVPDLQGLFERDPSMRVRSAAKSAIDQIR
jgi:hypothetical protein